MKVPIHNGGASILYVAGTMIPPGETRHFDEDQLPPEHRPAAAAPAPDAPGDPVAALLEGGVKEILPALAGLADEDLERAGALEQAGKQRKGVLAAIADLMLSRAEASLPGGGALDTPQG